jgi:hypothetical protein
MFSLEGIQKGRILMSETCCDKEYPLEGNNSWAFDGPFIQGVDDT